MPSNAFHNHTAVLTCDHLITADASAMTERASCNLSGDCEYDDVGGTTLVCQHDACSTALNMTDASRAAETGRLRIDSPTHADQYSANHDLLVLTGDGIDASVAGDPVNTTD